MSIVNDFKPEKSRPGAYAISKRHMCWCGWDGDGEYCPKHHLKMSRYDLRSVDSYSIEGQGRVYVVENPEECSNFDHILNGLITIDGLHYEIECVKVAGGTPQPYKKGERIGLLVIRG